MRRYSRSLNWLVLLSISLTLWSAPVRADWNGSFGNVSIHISVDGVDEMYVGSRKIFSGQIQSLPVTVGDAPSRIKPVRQPKDLDKMLIVANKKSYLLGRDGSVVEVPQLADRNFTAWDLKKVIVGSKAYEIFSVEAPGADAGTFLLAGKNIQKISNLSLNLNQLQVNDQGKVVYRGQEAGSLSQPSSLTFVAAPTNPGIPDSVKGLPESPYEAVFAKAKSSAAQYTALAPTLDPSRPKEFAQGVLQMKKEMHARVGQDNVTDGLVDMYSQVMRGDKKKPHRVMLVTGSTGSGKTYSGEMLAQYIFPSEALPPIKSPTNGKPGPTYGPPIDTQVLTVDASAFKGQDESMALFGPPPGTKGFGENKGLLPTFADTKNPNLPFMIIVNEADKASPSFWEGFMEILDKGVFTGRDGKVRRLGKGIIYLTANKGSDVIFPRQIGKALTPKEIEQRIAKFGDKEVKELFIKPDSKNLLDKSNTIPDSVVNRIDRAVAVPPVTFENALLIVRKEADQIEKTMKDDYGYSVHLDNRTIQHIVESTFSPEDGVRNPRQKTRALIEQIENKAALEFDLSSRHELNVTTVSDANGKNAKFIAYNVEDPSQVLTLPSELKPQYESPLKDPERRATLRNLSSQLKQRVFGQDDAIEVVSRAFRAKAVNPQLKTPVKLALFGSSGTGKTELAESIAEVMYGGRNRAKVFAMGNMKHPQQLDNFFGSARGTIGSDTRTEFEDFLINNREGGVAIFDEFGNMGNSPQEKETMRTRFMDMLDRGEYTTVQGDRIDLSNFTFVFTSNEGEEIFKGLPSDDLRQAMYEKAKDAQKFEAHLIDNHGYKEALINRLDGNTVLMKPLDKSDRFNIAKKELKKVLDPIQKEHGISEIEVSDEVYRQIAETFFTHTRGARSIGNLAKLDLGSVFGEILLQDQFDDPSVLAKSKIKITLADNIGHDIYMAKPNTPKDRKVVLSLHVETPGQSDQVFNVDVTRRAAEVRAVEKQNARKVAAHEAGHAIANDPKMTNSKIQFITIKSQGRYGGYARYSEPEPGQGQPMTRQAAVAHLAKMFGGVEGQKAFGFQADAGWSDDLQKAREFAESAVSQYGLTDNAADLPTEKGKVIMNNDKTQAEIQKLMAEGQELSRKRIYDHLPAMAAVARELVSQGQIEGDRFDELVTQAMDPKSVHNHLSTISKTAKRLKSRFISDNSELNCVYKKLLEEIATRQ